MIAISAWILLLMVWISNPIYSPYFFLLALLLSVLSTYRNVHLDERHKSLWILVYGLLALDSAMIRIPIPGYIVLIGIMMLLLVVALLVKESFVENYALSK